MTGELLLQLPVVVVRMSTLLMVLLLVQVPTLLTCVTDCTQ